MCFPALLGAVGGLFSGGGTGLATAASVAGTGLSAVGAIQSANAQAAGLRQQAELNERQAEIEQQRGAFEAQRERENAQRILARQRANFAASGVALEGTPTAVIEDTATETALDIAAIRYGSALRSGNFRTQASYDRANASSARTAGFISAGTNLFSGLARTRLSNPYAVG